MMLNGEKGRRRRRVLLISRVERRVPFEQVPRE
jgi:hypothetical protein